MKKARSKDITITPEVRKAINSFKKRLKEMAKYGDETSAFDVRTIDIILNELDDYDRNILCAYYSIAECRPFKLASYLGINSSIVCHRIKRIHTQIKKLNNVHKSNFNLPRDCDNS
jgi:hypothetical protein